MKPENFAHMLTLPTENNTEVIVWCWGKEASPINGCFFEVSSRKTDRAELIEKWALWKTCLSANLFCWKTVCSFSAINGESKKHCSFCLIWLCDVITQLIRTGYTSCHDHIGCMILDCLDNVVSTKGLLSSKNQYHAAVNLTSIGSHPSTISFCWTENVLCVKI